MPHHDARANEHGTTLAGTMTASDDDGGMATGGDWEAASNRASEKAARARHTGIKTIRRPD
jgi:hypothetical protein